MSDQENNADDDDYGTTANTRNFMDTDFLLVDDPGDRHVDPGDRHIDTGDGHIDAGDGHIDTGDGHIDTGDGRTDVNILQQTAKLNTGDLMLALCTFSE